jgi:hypothetical protein
MARRQFIFQEIIFGIAGVFIVFVILGLHSIVSRRSTPQTAVVTVDPSDVASTPSGSTTPSAAGLLDQERRANAERLSSLFEAGTQPTSALDKFQNSAFQPRPVGVPEDPFAEAVRMAERAAVGGQRAFTPREWLTLALHWQAASDLMAQVPAGDSRYLVAQDRVYRYLENSQVAMQKAMAMQGTR